MIYWFFKQSEEKKLFWLVVLLLLLRYSLDNPDVLQRLKLLQLLLRENNGLSSRRLDDELAGGRRC
jgi:hypothetical protein